MIGSIIYNRLSSAPAVTALVGSRIFPNYAREDQSYPQLVYEFKSVDPLQSYDGAETLTSGSLSVHCISTTYAECDTLGASVIASLNGNHWTDGATTVQGVFLDDGSEDQLTDPESERILYYLKELQFTVWYV